MSFSYNSNNRFFFFAVAYIFEKLLINNKTHKVKVEEQTRNSNGTISMKTNTVTVQMKTKMSFFIYVNFLFSFLYFAAWQQRFATVHRNDAWKSGFATIFQIRIFLNFVLQKNDCFFKQWAAAEGVLFENSLFKSASKIITIIFEFEPFV